MEGRRRGGGRRSGAEREEGATVWLKREPECFLCVDRTLRARRARVESGVY